MFRKILLVLFIYPLVFFWTTVSGLTGMLFSIVLRMPEFTLAFVPGRMWAPVILKLLGVRLVVQGTDNVKPDVPSIFVANHSSFLDIPACVASIRVNLNFIAKKELKNTPVVGWYISATKQIFIDRKDKHKAQRSMQVAAQRIREGKHVLSYAEGTRSLDGEVQIFRRGAFIIAKDGDIPIVPVAVSGAHACLPAKSWWVKRGTITITIGEAFRPSDYPLETPEQLAERARQRVIALMLALR